MLEHLRALREDRDLSQREMAEVLRVHQTTYSDYELGRLNIPIPTCGSWRCFLIPVWITSLD